MAVFKDYIKILKANLRQSAEKLSFLDFFQVNEPKQKKKYITRTWPLYNCPKVLDTPSPDNVDEILTLIQVTSGTTYGKLFIIESHKK